MKKNIFIHGFQTAFAVLLLFSGISYAGEPPKDPILSIESGMHTAKLSRVGVDAENRYVVTSSNDRTLRVWDLATGRLIRTIRIPIGGGNEGKIYSVALTPDGKTIACGGWTQFNNGSTDVGDDGFEIYLIDRETGAIKKRIKGLPNVILHMAYSKDGRFLVACLWGKNGIRLYRTSDYKQIGEDLDYGSDSYGADFSDPRFFGSTPLLAIASWDGYIRLYEVNEFGNPALRLLAKEKGKGGNRPFAVSMHSFGSKDDTRIAAGYDDAAGVDVFKAGGGRLQYLYSADVTGVGNSTLFTVTWSSDGRSLYAGGKYWKDGRVIRKWSDEGRGAYKDIPSGADNTILHMLPLAKGGIVFSTYDPAFGILNAQDQKVFVKTPSTADFRDNQEGFLTSYDGSVVQFGYEVWGKYPARFSLLDGILNTEPGADPRLAAPITTAAGLNVTDWKYTYAPKVNGTALKLNQYEASRSLAISPDGTRFLLGAEWYVRLFDGSGNEKWSVPVPGAAWAVNISGNGRVAVAALGDGTIRWYRMTDGKELLAFFPHKDRKRWILWSPSGYYSSSPGADELIGWHINNGKDAAADFFPVSKFKGTYYRPDVIAKELETLDEGEAVRLANAESGRQRQEVSVQAMLPPVVTIVSPGDRETVARTEVIVKYRVRTPSGEPVIGVKALVDGRPVAQERGIKIVGQATGQAEDLRELKVSVPERDAEITVIAENRFASSEAATVRIKWAGKVQRDEFIIKPKLYVLSIGVSAYRDKKLVLGLAAKDARDFATALVKQQGEGMLYREVVEKVLTDEQATKDDILDGLDWIQKQTTSKDVAMVFLAGHGVNDSNGIYYYLPVNADIEKLKRSAVPFSDIKNTIASLAGKTLFFIDTCHSGNIMGSRRGISDLTGVINELTSAENGAVVFASSTGNQYSLEDPSWGNGAFTKALVEGFGGKADYTGKGKISINMLDLYLSERVKDLTKGKQTPTTTKPQTVPDFPIAVRK